MSEASAPVAELIRLREQLIGWIARLDEVGTEASSRVTERVREDYRDRLRRLDDDLASHLSEIDAELERFRDSLGEVEARRTSAVEALEEGRLRHLIGELAPDAWEEARPELERELADAEETVARVTGEVERLATLSAEIAGSRDAPAELVEAVWTPEGSASDDPDATREEGVAPPVAAAEPIAPVRAPATGRDVGEGGGSADGWDPFGGEFGTETAPETDPSKDDLPWLSGIEGGTEWPESPGARSMAFLEELDTPEAAPSPAPGAAPIGGTPGETAPDQELGADDLAFLEELDRTIGGAPTRPAAATPQAAPRPEESVPTPAPGGRGEPLLCKECGAINEPHSWYCEICGSEL
jgi:hypothetical protein